MGKAQREKGARGERELAEILRGYGYDSHRGAQHKGSKDSPDVTGIEGLHIECKRVEALNIYAAIEQADRDCAGNIPVVMHRKNNKPWLATMHLEDFLRIYGDKNADRAY